MWIMLILLFLVMWLFMIRPQRKQQKALEEMRKALKKGDHVVTAGGIYGTICDVDDRTVLIKHLRCGRPYRAHQGGRGGEAPRGQELHLA